MTRACLDDNEITELLAGQLRDAQRAELEAHLDACDACRQLVAELAHLSEEQRAETQPEEQPDHSAEAVTAPLSSHHEPAPAPAVGPGDRIDHFELLGRLGQGGMGDVYAAWDTKLDRKVALKMVRPQLLGSAEALARFEREARATARFSHPNIVTIHEVGEHEGRPYVALEFLSGRTLAERMLDGPPELAEVVRIGRAVVEALAEAHRHGVLHRDLKLHNVHVDEQGRIRVLDFGLAKLVAEDPTASPDAPLQPTSDLFQTEGFAATGTPMTMAPEQWRGEPSHEATDVWAVGVLLFTVLTEQMPFEGSTVRELRAAVIGPGEARRVDAIRSSVPEALVELVAACLAKEPEARPSTAELLAVLGRLAEPDTPPVRRRGGWVLGAVASVVVVLGTVWGLRSGAEPGRESSSTAEGSKDRSDADAVDKEVSASVAPTPAVAPVREGPVPPASESSLPPSTPSEPAAMERAESPKPEAPPASAPVATRRSKAGPRKRRPANKDKEALFGTRE